MHIVPFGSSVASARVDLIVLGLGQDHFASDPTFKSLDAALDGELLRQAREQDFTAKPRQQMVVVNVKKASATFAARRVALFGLGKGDGPRRLRHELFVRLGGTATRLGNSFGAKQALVAVGDAVDAEAQAICTELLGRGIALGAYRYSVYRREPGRAQSLQKVHLQVGAAASQVSDSCRAALAVATAVARVRDWVNEPANDLYPQSFAARATKLCKAAAVQCRVLEPAQLRKAGMGLLLAVGQGSERGPRLVHLSYTPKGRGGRGRAPKKAPAPVVLVGKGITFDSGGLSLKSPDAMYGMKMDMAGAAAVLATLLAAAEMRLEVPVHGILALAENMPSGHAIRPGDIVKSAAGKTIEINNTDAEGRLVLADALNYALQLQPRCIVDLATLTGACMIALGHHTTGLFSNRDSLAAALLGASAQAGEDFWRLPLTPVLRDQLRSDVADMRNTGERYGGAITAALFLQEFVGKTPWAHLDIAGPATSQEDGGAATKGGSGVAVATLLTFLRQLPHSFEADIV